MTTSCPALAQQRQQQSPGVPFGGLKERRGLETHLCLELSGMFYSYFYSTTNLKTIKQTARTATATTPLAPNHHSINISSLSFPSVKIPGKMCTATTTTATIPAGNQPPQQPQRMGLEMQIMMRLEPLSFLQSKPRDDVYSNNNS